MPVVRLRPFLLVRLLLLVGSAVLVAAVLFRGATGTTGSDPPGSFEFGGGYPGGGMLAAFSADGKTVCVGGPRSDLTLLDAATGRYLRTLTAEPEGGAAGGTTALAVSPDGKTVAACVIVEHPQADRTKRLGWELRLWDLAAGRLTARHRGDRWEVHSLAFSRDGRLLAGVTGGFDPAANREVSDVYLWEAPGWARKRVIRVADRVPAQAGRLAFTPGGDGEVLNLLVGTGLRRWDPATGRELPSRFEPFGPRAVSPDGKTQANMIYVTDKQGRAIAAEVALIDLATSTRTAAARGHTQEAEWLAFAPDGSTLTTVSPDGTAIIWDAATLARRATLTLPGPRTYSHYGPPAYSPDGGTLVVPSAWGPGMGEVSFWDAQTGKLRFVAGRHHAQVWSVAFHPGGKVLASSENLPVIKLWDVASGQCVGVFSTGENDRTICSIAYSPDGKMLAAAAGHAVRLFDPGTGKLTATLTGHTSGVNALAFSPDGGRLASAAGTVRWVNDVPTQDPGEVIVWHLATGKPARVLRAHAAGCFSVAFRPDGKLLATGGGDAPRAAGAGAAAEAVRLWDPATGAPVTAHPADPGHPVTALAFSPDGQTLAHNGLDGGRLRLIDPLTGAERAVLRGKGAAAVAVAFSPDGRVLAAVGEGSGANARRGLIELWDVGAGRLIESWPAHTEPVNCVAFRPDGKAFATGGSDRAVWLWPLLGRE